MDAKSLAWSLNGRHAGRQWLCRCPVPEHGRGRGDMNPSLIIFNGHTSTQVRCLAGCHPLTVIAVLRDRGLWEEKAADERATSYQRRATPPPPVSPAILIVWRRTGLGAGGMVSLTPYTIYTAADRPISATATLPASRSRSVATGRGRWRPQRMSGAGWPVRTTKPRSKRTRPTNQKGNNHDDTIAGSSCSLGTLALALVNAECHRAAIRSLECRVVGRRARQGHEIFSEHHSRIAAECKYSTADLFAVNADTGAPIGMLLLNNLPITQACENFLRTIDGNILRRPAADAAAVPVWDYKREKSA